MSKVPVGWEVKLLGELFPKIVVGYVGNVNNYYCSSTTGVPFYRTLNIRNGFFRKNEVVYVTKEFHKANKKSQIFNQDILIARVGANLGMVCKVEGLETEANIANAIIIKATKSYNSDFYTAFLLSKEGRDQIFSGAAGGAQGVFNTKLAQKISVPVPPLSEQTKIAQILSTWDKAIATTEKLIGNSQQQKKALMQSLLTGKKRLTGFEESNEYQTTRYGKIPLDWGFKPVDDIAKNISIKNKEGKDYPVLSCSKYSGFIDSLKYFNKKIYSDNTDGYKIIKKGWFGFPSNHIEEGSIGLQSLYEVGIVSPIYIIFKVNENIISSLYLYALFKTDHYKQIFSASTNASVDRRGSLRWDEFGKIKVPVPPLPEQQKIAAILTAADNEIELLQKKLVFLKQEKAALMQQLLTGKRRVKIDTTEECMDA